MMGDELVKIDFDEILAESDDAYRFQIGDDKHWIPKSQISTVFEKIKVVHITEWIAAKKGLI